MSVRSAQAITVEFTTSSPTTQAAVNADSLPTGTLVVNGTDNGASVTVTNVDTGRYKAAVTLPTLAVNDVVELMIAATVGTIAGKAIVWRDTKDVFAGAIPDVAAGGSSGLLISGSNTGTTTLGALTVTGNLLISAGLSINQSTTDGHGIAVAGNGAGDAIKLTGGTTGHALEAIGGTGTAAVSLVGTTTGSGLEIIAGASGAGVTITGGSSSGRGVLISTVSGDGLSILPTAGHAIVATANGPSKHGLFVTGGTSGTSDGVKAVAGTGGVDVRGNITGTLTTVTTVTNQLTAAQIATGIWQDTTAGDFTVALSVGKSLMNGVSLGTGLTVAAVSGSVGSVTGAVGSVTGAVGSVTAGVTLAASQHVIVDSGTVTTLTNLPAAPSNWLTAAAIADGAIDRATFAADTGLQSVRSGTAAAGGSTTLTLDGGASALNGFYTNCLLALTGGTGAGQARFVTGYVGSTKVATVGAWTTTPDNTTTFSIAGFDSIPGAVAPTAVQVAAAVWQDATAGDFTVAGSIGKSLYTSGASPGAASGLALVGSNVGTAASVSGAVGSVAGDVAGKVLGGGASSITNVGVRASVTASDVSGDLPANVIQWSGVNVPAVNVGGVPVVDVGYSVGVAVTNEDGTAQGGTTGGVTLAASSSATTDYYKNRSVTIVSGTGVGQASIVTAYNGSTKVAAVSPSFATAPDASSRYVLGEPVGAAAPTVVQIRTEMDANSTQLAAIAAKTTNLPGSPAAVGSAMTLADGAITDAKITFPAETAGRPTTFLAAMRRLWEWAANKRTRDRSSGTLLLRNAADNATLETQTQQTSGTVDTQTKGA